MFTLTWPTRRRCGVLGTQCFACPQSLDNTAASKAPSPLAPSPRSRRHRVMCRWAAMDDVQRNRRMLVSSSVHTRNDTKHHWPLARARATVAAALAFAQFDSQRSSETVCVCSGQGHSTDEIALEANSQMLQQCSHAERWRGAGTSRSCCRSHGPNIAITSVAQKRACSQAYP